MHDRAFLLILLMNSRDFLNYPILFLYSGFYICKY